MIRLEACPCAIPSSVYVLPCDAQWLYEFISSNLKFSLGVTKSYVKTISDLLGRIKAFGGHRLGTIMGPALYPVISRVSIFTRTISQ